MSSFSDEGERKNFFDKKAKKFHRFLDPGHKSIKK